MTDQSQQQYFIPDLAQINVHNSDPNSVKALQQLCNTSTPRAKQAT